jgi:hypothetical protein
MSNMRLHTHTYREDTCKKTLIWAFLGGGSASPVFNEGDPATTVMATMVANEHGGTCKVMNR